MKRLLLWLVGVALGVVVLLGAVMAVSYAFTTQGSCPAPEVRFGDEALEVNGSCWQVPLLSGQLDKVFASPETLTVQKLDPDRAEAWHSLRRAPGPHPAGVGQLCHPDH